MSLHAMAIAASEPLGPFDWFAPCTEPFFDGLGFSLPGLKFETVKSQPQHLITSLRRSVETLTFNWATFSYNGSEPFLWLTPSPGTSELSEFTVRNFLQAKRALQEHAKVHWGCSEEETGRISISKLDTTIDLKGSFIPEGGKQRHKWLQPSVKLLVDEFFSRGQQNFLSMFDLKDLRVVRGDNILDTCFQYAVLNREGVRLLNIKIYEKTLDMIGRDGY